MWTFCPSLSTATVTGKSLHFELVDGFHAKVREADDLRALDGARDEIGRAADRHQIGALVVADRLGGGGTALGLADHRQQALLQHHAGELVHAGGGGGAGGADHFLADRIDRADIIDDAAGELDGERLARVEHVLDALVRGVAAGEHLPVEQEAVALLPALH